jgi:tetratricopeptide (TPR) repeat protein
LAYDSLGQYEKAIDYYQQALASLQKRLGPDHPNVMTVAANLAVAKGKQENVKAKTGQP